VASTDPQKRIIIALKARNLHERLLFDDAATLRIVPVPRTARAGNVILLLLVFFLTDGFDSAIFLLIRSGTTGKSAKNQSSDLDMIAAVTHFSRSGNF